MNIVIQRATLSGIFLNYDFEQKDFESNNLMKVKSDLPVHEDLRNAFRRFIPHFVAICEQEHDKKLIEKAVKNPDAYVLSKEEAPDDSFFKYTVHTVVHNSKKGQNCVTISGCRLVGEFGDEISFTSPEIDLEDNEYTYTTELAQLVEEWKIQVKAYMEGKHAPKAQLEMFSEEEENDLQEPAAAFTSGK